MARWLVFWTNCSGTSQKKSIHGCIKSYSIFVQHLQIDNKKENYKSVE